jgi:hypothetical protein
MDICYFLVALLRATLGLVSQLFRERRSVSSLVASFVLGPCHLSLARGTRFGRARSTFARYLRCDPRDFTISGSYDSLSWIFVFFGCLLFSHSVVEGLY